MTTTAAIDRRTSLRFPLAALLITQPETAPDVNRVADLLAEGRVYRALGEAHELTYASYHPIYWGL